MKLRAENKSLKRYDFFVNGSLEYKTSFQYSYILVIIIFSIIVIKLWYLQIFQGDKFRHMSENNRIRILKVTAPRGTIYDRNGEILVDNRPSFNVSIILEDLKYPNKTISLLAKILNINPMEIKKKLLESKKITPRYLPIRIKTDINRNELALIEANRFDLPGVITEVEPLRNYIYGDMGAHLLGYIGEINERELKIDRFSDLDIGDSIGKYGIEERWDRFLRGMDGEKEIEVDATGKLIKVLNEINELPGENLILTIDLHLQKIAYEAMKDKVGAIIAMNPKNGEILAIHSSPSFDPNLFAKGISPKEWENLINDPLNPLQNRCIQGQYPPGSTFKPLVAIAGLESRVITPETSILCPGYYSFGTRIYRCWKRKGHGIINLYKAISESCDVYFYQVALRLGVDKLASYAFMFGLGKTTGINLKYEKKGIVPSTYWKKKAFKERWYEGETLSVGIGQGFNLLTPLQLLNLYCMIANGGIQYLPRVVKKIEDMNGNIIKEYKPKIVNRADVSKNTLRIIKKALFEAVNEKDGTGKLAKIDGINVAGKTGTAQVVSLKRKTYKLKDHAWFVAFAPVEDPEIAVVVLIEHGGHGGSAAAPIAKEIIEGYFDLKNDR
jgi:penicillin-binding protein 2